jgi:peroxiredoxin Q/BCP
MGFGVLRSLWGRTYHGVLRATLLIDVGGLILRVFEKVKPSIHSAEILKALEQLGD